MDATVRYSAKVPSVPWRPIVVAVLLVALVAAALLVAGSQQRVPPPFGPAKNGALLFGNGDIYVRDGIDGASRLLIGGPTDDFAAGFTRDGARMTFLRRTSGTAGTPSERIQMFVAGRDGSNPTAFTDPLRAPDWADMSPDSSVVVVAAGAPVQHLFVADVRHPGTPQQLDLGSNLAATTFPNFLGPTGAEIVFRGSKVTAEGIRYGIFAVRPDGTGLRPITPTDGREERMGYTYPQPSPDGRFVAYTSTDPDLRGLQVHLVDLRTGADRNLTDVARSEGWATFSPDSSRILFMNYIADQNQVFVAPVDGSGPRLAMGPSYRMVNDQYLSGIFSPDGKWVIVTDSASGETRLVDAATGGDGELLAWSTADVSGWQRLAP